MRVRTSVVLFDESRRKVLLLHYCYHGQDVFGVPGGNPEPRELLSQALVRELKEEVNLDIEVGRLLWIGEVVEKDGSAMALHCIFSGEILQGTPQVNPEHTTSAGVEWHDIASLSGLHLYPNIGHLIQEVAAGTGNSEVYLGEIPYEWV